MKSSDIYGKSNLWFDDLQSQAERDRRARRLVDQVLEEQLAALSRENAELRTAVAAMATLLVERGVLVEGELARKIQELTPPAAPKPEPGPFDNLRDCSE